MSNEIKALRERFSNIDGGLHNMQFSTTGNMSLLMDETRQYIKALEELASRPTEPKTKIAEHGKAQYDKVGNVAIYPDNKDYKPVGKRFILVPVCDEATK